MLLTHPHTGQEVDQRIESKHGRVTTEAHTVARKCFTHLFTLSVAAAEQDFVTFVVLVH
jgi:hypothetical protein